MECLAENQCCEEAAMDDGRGMKRLSVEAEQNIETKKVKFREDGVYQIFGTEHRCLEEINLNVEGIEEVRVTEGFDRSCGDAGESSTGDKEDGILKGKDVSFSSAHQLNNNVGVVNERKDLDFDLNLSIWEVEDEPMVGEKKREIVEISSDDSDEEDVIVVAENKGKMKLIEEINTYRRSSDDSDEEDVIVVAENMGKMKLIEEINTYRSYDNVRLGSGELDLDLAFADSSELSGMQRYTREEKGKAKVRDSWLSLTNVPIQMDILDEWHEFGIKPNAAAATSFHFDAIGLGQNGDQFLDGNLELRVGQTDACSTVEMPVQFQPVSIARSNDQLPVRNLELGREQAIADDARTVDPSRQRADAIHREIMTYSARRFARFNSQEENNSEGSSGQKEKPSSVEIDEQLGNSPGPFSDALKMIRERCLKKNAQQLICWKGPQNTENNTSTPLIPSLLDLSLKMLVQNAEALFSLEGVPDTLRKRLADLLCDSRKMNTRLLGLLLQGSPTEIRVKDCSWLTEDDFSKLFGDCVGQNMMVLQLDLCGQCLLDHVLGKTLARSSHSLPKLGILSLRGACRISDDALKTLVASAPMLQSIDLGQCSLLTQRCIDIISNSLGSSLKELHINECQRIDVMHIISALKNIKHLEVLSVAGIHTICDQFVCEMVPACGQNLKELNLADCEKLTDCSLKAIGDACADLRSLNISNLRKVTDAGIQFLANGCRSIQRLNLRSNGFSDEAIAAYIEASGQALEELSLNNCSKVGPNTALSLAKCSKKLQCLDLSWCRRVTDDSLGLIVDSCVFLKLVKLFGCTQITSIFVNGHSNSLVQIVGLQMSPILDNINKFEPEEVFLRYSSL